MRSSPVPIDIQAIKDQAAKAVFPLQSPSFEKFHFRDEFTTVEFPDANSKLPRQYLVYLMLVNLLEFSTLPRGEKTLWSIPLELNDRLFLLEYGKFGYRLLTRIRCSIVETRDKLVRLINHGVAESDRYFRWRAEEKLSELRLVVENRSIPLFERYHYFLTLHKNALEGVSDRENNMPEDPVGRIKTVVEMESLKEESSWLAQAAIEAFFNWTEHVFILLYLLRSVSIDRADIEEIIGSSSRRTKHTLNWRQKYKKVFNMQDRSSMQHFSQLCEIRNSLRNFIAHGALGKLREGDETFFSSPIEVYFPSHVGRIPLRQCDDDQQASWRFETEVGISEERAVSQIEHFIEFLWKGDRRIARIFIQERGLPLFLPWVSDGTYRNALISEEAMVKLVDRLAYENDRFQNMEF